MIFQLEDDEELEQKDDGQPGSRPDPVRT
jgi:hypothetical protein